MVEFGIVRLALEQKAKRVCEEQLTGRYKLESIDVYQQPVLAKGEPIFVAPNLIKKLPDPLSRLMVI